jgi:hypothetical protein
MDAYLKMDLTGIVVDHDFYMNEKFFNRMRFSFAHELGHYFLHQDIFATFNVNSPEGWKISSSPSFSRTLTQSKV